MGARGDLAPARPVRAPGDQVEHDVVAAGEGGDDRDRVLPGADRHVRHGGDVHGDRHRAGCAERTAHGPVPTDASPHGEVPLGRSPPGQRSDAASPARQPGAQCPVRGDPDQPVGDRLDVTRVDLVGRATRGRDRAGDDRGADAHRLDDGETEALDERHVGHETGLAVEPGEHAIADLPGEDDARGCGPGRCPHPSGPTTTSGSGSANRGRAIA